MKIKCYLISTIVIFVVKIIVWFILVIQEKRMKNKDKTFDELNLEVQELRKYKENNLNEKNNDNHQKNKINTKNNDWKSVFKNTFIKTRNYFKKRKK